MLGSGVYAQTWTGSQSSDWGNSANWSGNVPSSGSTVTIPGGTPHSPEITGSVIIKKITIGDWNNPTTLTVNGGSLTVKENVTLTNYGELKMISGSILLRKDKNNSSFSFAYTGAKITLLDGTFTSKLNIQANGSLTTGAAEFNMEGDLTIHTSSLATASPGSVWNIEDKFEVNGTLDFDGDSLLSSGHFKINSGGVVNAGTGYARFDDHFDVESNGTYNGENATTDINDDISANSSAYISVNNGALNFNGDVELKNNATIEVLGSGTVSIDGDGEFKQDGSLLIANGNLEIDGDVEFKQGGTLDVDGGNITIDGDAKFKQSGVVNVGSGSLTIEGDAKFEQTGTVNAENGTININGDLELKSTNATFNAGSSTINLSGGEFKNNGTFNPDSSTVNFVGDGDQEIDGDITFFNLNIDTDGNLNAEGTVLVLNNAAIDPNASVTIEPGESLDVQGNLDDPSGSIASDRPFVRGIVALGANKVKVEFSEPISTSTGNNSSNYSVTPGGFSITPSVQSNARFIELTLSGNMSPSVRYSFKFNNLVGTNNGNTIGHDHIKFFNYTPLVNPPSQEATNLIASQVGENTATINWNPNGAQGSIVVVREGAPVSFVPSDYTSYPVSSIFGNGSDAGNDQFIVYAGSGSSATFSGLDPKKVYHIAVFTFNGTLPNGVAYYTAEVGRLKFGTAFPLDVKFFLGGAMNSDGTAMETNLINNNALPLAHSFNALTNYTGPNSISSYPVNNIVDWVLVEVREANSPGDAVDSTVSMRRPALLLSDGSVVDLDGTSLPLLRLNNGGAFVVAIYHRNHIPVFSGDTISKNSSNVHAIDFTTSAGSWFEESSAVEITPGIFGAPSGKSIKPIADGGSNTPTENSYEVDLEAYNKAWVNRNNTGYLEDDVDLNGLINASDRVKIFNSRNKSITIPAQGGN